MLASPCCRLHDGTQSQSQSQLSLGERDSHSERVTCPSALGGAVSSQPASQRHMIVYC